MTKDHFALPKLLSKQGSKFPSVSSRCVNNIVFISQNDHLNLVDNVLRYLILSQCLDQVFPIHSEMFLLNCHVLV